VHQTRAAALAEHVFQRLDDLGIRECGVAAVGRHGLEAVQGVVFQHRQTFGEMRSPFRLIADSGRAQGTGLMTGGTGAFPDLLAGLGHGAGTAADGRRRGRSRLGPGIAGHLHVADGREPLVNEFFLRRSAAIVGTRFIPGDVDGQPVGADGKGDQDAEHQQEGIEKMLVMTLGMRRVVWMLHGVPLW